MSKRILLLLMAPVLFLSVATTSCSSKPKDADIKADVDKAIAANSDLSGISTTVNEGVVTLSGEVMSETTRTSAETTARQVKGVKSVTNNVTVAVPPPTVTITPDDPLKVSVDNTIKDYPGVTASINDGVVTLTGEIKRTDLTKLMAALNALKPKKVENKLTIKS
jgi:hyperosmotically inducible protein